MIFVLFSSLIKDWFCLSDHNELSGSGSLVGDLEIIKDTQPLVHRPHETSEMEIAKHILV